MTAPERSLTGDLVGAWRRVGLSVDGRRQVDRCDVLWVQADEWFADIRLRIDPSAPSPDPWAGLFAETAFAGRAHWDPPDLTWEHLVDADPATPIDSSPLEWADGVVVERFHTTVAGRTVTVTEEWLRMADSRAPSETAVADGDIRVRVGRWAVHVRDRRPSGPFVATRSEAGPGGWATVGELEVRSA